ncbi:hypothetical protein GCM10009840_04120 [Pseudolysinimonas kribbensis]|uniref:Integral membrane protein n=1 Tax=Pseudolysinimonas kribbensis TaxID=433641 RepID=A0ABQ6K2A7_9MICO|nr:hypothetical protein [Pseudolysinimonas kribbensis]GMA94738.1 hypothetical protein GCM10025881_15620 [Pseudolysinimonas kribbensis]
MHAIVHIIDNPLNGLLPNFSIFGVQFTALWQKLLAGAWGIAIVAAVIFLIIGIASMATASAATNPMEYKVGRQKTVWAAISLGLLAALAVIVGAILAVFS